MRDASGGPSYAVASADGICPLRRLTDAGVGDAEVGAYFDCFVKLSHERRGRMASLLGNRVGNDDGSVGRVV